MPERDYRDILGGAILVLLGGSVAIYSLTSLSVGTMSRMGPGMFPAGLGVILAGLGLAVLVPALLRGGEKLTIDLRSFIAVSLSIFAFGIIVQPFGLIPAIVALTAIASRADSKLSPIGTATVAACLALGATLIFRVGLGLQLASFNWPW